MLTVPDAARRILASLAPLPAETVTLAEARGRVLAAPVVADRALPEHDNSAMDGFAVRANDLPGTLLVTGTVAAGAPPDAELAPGAAVRIMTGAPVPRGADAVVIREEVDDRGDEAAFDAAPRRGDHIRRAGEDVAPGDEVIAAGAVLGPGEIGLFAALNRTTAAVARRPRVAVLSTGDELVEVGEPAPPGARRSSNAHALAAQIREAGGEPIDLGIARDRRTDLVAALERAHAADVVVTSGGVSAGDYDHVRDAFADAGIELAFWKVAMKPGKPLAFGRTASGTAAFGLPGNPVSSMVVFELFVRPALLWLQGAREITRPRAPVTLAAPCRKSPGRAHYVRARVERRGRELLATPLARQGSGMLSSMVGVDALVELDADAGDVAAGAEVPAILLRAV